MQDALQQFSDTEKWREANLIGDLYDNIDIADYEETRKLVSEGIQTSIGRIYSNDRSYSIRNGLAEEVRRMSWSCLPFCRLC